ncbi:MAG: hypothetical protein PVF58_06775 [Candidatus Methanofastidiosia archaeon]
MTQKLINCNTEPKKGGEKMDFGIEELEEVNPKHPGCTTIRFTVGYL